MREQNKTYSLHVVLLSLAKQMQIHNPEEGYKTLKNVAQVTNQHAV